MNDQEMPQRDPRKETEEPTVRPDAEKASSEAERSAFAMHRDPSLTAGRSGRRVGRGVEWVRPSDLIAASSARAAGRGIDFQAELARQARRAPGQAVRAGRDGVRAVRERAESRPRRVQNTSPEPDVFDVGYRRPSSSWVRPSGIGLG